MHPPVNITSNTTFSDDNSMNYTIRLTHGSPFWTTIFDAKGASWSSGPYHAGTNQNVGCLATLTGQDAVGESWPISQSHREIRELGLELWLEGSPVRLSLEVYSPS